MQTTKRKVIVLSYGVITLNTLACSIFTQVCCINQDDKAAMGLG